MDWLDDLLSTENLDEEVSSHIRNNCAIIYEMDTINNVIFQHIGEIFDATEEFLFDHLDTDNEDMYNSDYFGLSHT